MNFCLKTLANFLMAVLALPMFAAYRISVACVGPDRTFPGWSQFVSLIPGFTGIYLRRAFYQLVLSRCDTDACIQFGVIISHPTAQIGRTVYVGPYSCLGDVTLEDDVIIASHVSVMNGNQQHGIERLDIPIREQARALPRVTIGRDSWIGERAVVQADVGKHCVIGAGAVVTKPIPDYAVAVGVPAKVVRFRHQPDHSNNIADSPNTPCPTVSDSE